MNKPATKEPSMDEILSSIRQIIADDDAAAAPPSSAPRPVPPPAASPPRPAPVPPARAVTPSPEPLALSAAQIVETPAATPSGSDFSALAAELDEEAPDAEMSMSQGDAQLLDPEDIAFEPEPEPEPAPPPVLRAPEPPLAAPQRPPVSVAQAAPMPDPRLSTDMAEELLAPTTDAAVQGAMARLSAMPMTGIGGMTVEAMIREMLRPMLKDWLDENLPALVERVVEKEISRISRGVK